MPHTNGSTYSALIYANVTFERNDYEYELPGHWRSNFVRVVALDVLAKALYFPYPHRIMHSLAVALVFSTKYY